MIFDKFQGEQEIVLFILFGDAMTTYLFCLALQPEFGTEWAKYVFKFRQGAFEKAPVAVQES